MRKEFHLLKNIYLSNTRGLDSIYKLLFAITFKCNLKCKICSIWKIPHRKEISVGEIEQMFKKLTNLSWLDLTGGEITLREDLVDIIGVIIHNAKNLKIFHMTTNGMNPQRIIDATNEVVKRKLNPIVSVSIDGPQQIHDRLRGEKGSYVKIVETFKALKALKKGRIYISSTISNFNYLYLDELIASLHNDIPHFSLSDLHFNFFHVSPHYYGNEKLEGQGKDKIDFKLIKKYLDLTKKGNIIKKFLEANYVKYLEKYLHGEESPFVCQAMHGSVFVDPYGEVFPCLFYNRAIGKLHEHEYDINKLLKDPQLNELKNQIENKQCPHCWAPCEAYPTILGSLKTIFGKNQVSRAPLSVEGDNKVLQPAYS